MPEHLTDDDLIAQLRAYAPVIDEATGPVSDDLTSRPYVISGSAPSRSARPPARRFLAVAAVAATLVGGIALVGRGIDTATDPATAPGTEAPAPGLPPSAGPVSPRLIATDLPIDVQPDAAVDGESGVGMPEGPAPMTVAAATTQVFATVPGGDRVAVQVDPHDRPAADEGALDATRLTVRGVLGHAFDDAGVRRVQWFPARGNVTAHSADLSASELRAFVEALQARGDDPLAGFDTGSTTSTLVAEHVSARGTEQSPTGRAWYSDGGERAVLVESIRHRDGAAPLDLAGSWVPVDRVDIAGAPRVVTRPGGSRYRTVTWFLPDGTQAVVHARGLDEAELAQIVGGVRAATDAEWRDTVRRADDRLRRKPVLAEVTTDVGTVVAYGERPPGSYGDDIVGLCLTVRAGSTGCRALAASDDNAGGVGVYGPTGSVGPLSRSVGQLVAGVVVDDRWYALGVTPGSVEVTARGADDLPVASAYADGRTLFVAPVTDGAATVTVEVPVSRPGTSPGSTTPGTFRADLPTATFRVRHPAP